MTTHGDMIMEYGGVPVGAGRLAKIFQAKNIFFVDGDHGRDGASGKKPAEAVALPSVAVGLAAKEGILYIRPRTTIDNEDVYYSDEIVVPITKPHIQLIGAGSGTVPGYRGAAQIRPSSAVNPIIDILSSGCAVENLHINHTGGNVACASLQCSRRAAYPGAVALQVRNCRFISLSGGGSDGDIVGGAVGLGSAQYSIVEDNLFLGCRNSITMWATHGSPQGITIRRNIFAGMVLERDADIVIGITDINSRGHAIVDNYFLDGQPNHAEGLKQKFIWSESVTTSTSTGIIARNFFADKTAIASVDGYGKTGSAGLIGEFWWFVGNHNEVGLIPRKD